MKLTVPDAAQLARTTEANLRTALATGELRSLERAHVEAWARAQRASIVTSVLGPAR